MVVNGGVRCDQAVWEVTWGQPAGDQFGGDQAGCGRGQLGVTSLAGGIEG